MRIDLHGLEKAFVNGQEVLKGITVSEEFEALAVIGPSGGGKSTLLRILGGLIPLSSGEVLLDGSPVPRDERSLLAYRKEIGFVFQSKGLFNHLTGMQNITLPLVHVHGYPQDRADAIAEELLTRFGLAEDGHKLPSELSGGQQQRIAIARAIAPRPKLLLLDEPTSALDPELTNEVLDMVGELRNEKLNLIVVTHEMGFAKKACDKLFFLVGGRLLEHGGSEALFKNPQTPELRNFFSKILEWNV